MAVSLKGRPNKHGLHFFILIEPATVASIQISVLYNLRH
uniref:Uncharacterized protein n=1 Tax=Anguilla anguilla TaxID=7936 RepID=A0A0E9RGH4_ANGAN